jgi:hypothetical protein
MKGRFQFMSIKSVASSEQESSCLDTYPQYTNSRNIEGHMVHRDTRARPDQCSPTKNTIGLYRQMQNLEKGWYCTTLYYGLWRWPAAMELVGQEDHEDTTHGREIHPHYLATTTGLWDVASYPPTCGYVDTSPHCPLPTFPAKEIKSNWLHYLFKTEQTNLIQPVTTKALSSRFFMCRLWGLSNPTTQTQDVTYRHMLTNVQSPL